MNVREKIEEIIKENHYPVYKSSYTQQNKRQVQGYMVMMTSYRRMDATVIKLQGSQQSKKFQQIKEMTFEDFKLKLKETFGESKVIVGYNDLTIIH